MHECSLRWRSEELRNGADGLPELYGLLRSFNAIELLWDYLGVIAGGEHERNALVVLDFSASLKDMRSAVPPGRRRAEADSISTGHALSPDHRTPSRVQAETPARSKRQYPAEGA